MAVNPTIAGPYGGGGGGGTPLARLFEWLEKHPPRGRRSRRRKSPVPMLEWSVAFAIAQRLFSEALVNAMDQLANTEGVTAPRLYGSYIRQIFNKIVGPKIHQILAMKPGVESPEEIEQIVKQAMQEFINNVLKNEAELRKLLAERGLTEQVINEYVEYTKKLLPYLERLATQVRVA